MDTFQLLEHQLNKNNLQKKGIIHIGAHLGQEAETYNKMGFKNVMWMEANPELYTQLKDNVSKYGHSVYNSLVSDSDSEDVNFFVTSNKGHSSSMLALGDELLKAGLNVTKKITLKSARFDTFCKKNDVNIDQYNCLNLDVQGAELKVLSGFGNMLKNFDFIITEISLKRLYKSSVLFHDLNSFLLKNGFVKISTSALGTMGEALYKRSDTEVSYSDKLSSNLSTYIIEMLVWLGIPQFFYKNKNGLFGSMIRSFYLKTVRK